MTVLCSQTRKLPAVFGSVPIQGHTSACIMQHVLVSASKCETCSDGCTVTQGKGSPLSRSWISWTTPHTTLVQ